MQSVTVQNLLSPMRLDRYLRTLSPKLTQGLIEQSLRKGMIKFKGAKASASTRINNGDIIELANHFQLETEQEYIEFSAPVITLAKKLLNEYLIEDHENFFAINKPRGISTQGGSNLNISIDHALKYLNQEGHDLRLVHRLDKETSGVMLIAKNRLAATKLGHGFQHGLIKKHYLALVRGSKIEPEGRIESYLLKVPDKIIESSQSNPEAKLAISDYKVIEEYGEGVKLIEFAPLTGRMHQIRCHAAYSLKNPIIGDDRYGGDEAKRLMLHALRISIPETVFGEKFVIEAKSNLPTSFNYRKH